MLKLKKYRFLIPVAVLFIFGAWLDPYADAVTSGNNQYNDKKYPQADKDYKKAEKYLPSKKDRSKLAFNRGAAKYMQGEYDEALEYYKQALKSDDKEIQKKAMFNLGNTYQKKGETRSAVESYINALKIDPAYKAAKKNLEYLLMDKKEDKKKDQNKKDKNNKSDNKNKEKKQNKDNKEKNKDNQKKKNQPDNSNQQKSKTGLNKEQVKNLLQRMKNKPVRRQKGKNAEGSQYLKNAW